jgi:hypothetical protein
MILSAKRLDQPPPPQLRLLVNGNWGVHLSTHLHLVSSLRTRRFVRLLPNINSRHGG